MCGKKYWKTQYFLSILCFFQKIWGKENDFFIFPPYFIAFNSFLPKWKIQSSFQYYGRKKVLNSFPNKIYNKVLFKEVRKIHIFFALAVTLFDKIRHDHPQTWMATWKVEWCGFWRILFFPEWSFCPERQLLKIIVWIWCFAFLIFFLMLGII